ncbi:unnamed protein product [Calypogeia fissa]
MESCLKDEEEDLQATPDKAVGTVLLLVFGLVPTFFLKQNLIKETVFDKLDDASWTYRVGAAQRLGSVSYLHLSHHRLIRYFAVRGGVRVRAAIFSPWRPSVFHGDVKPPIHI